MVADETFCLNAEDIVMDRAKIRIAKLEDGRWTWATSFQHGAGSANGSSSPLFHPDGDHELPKRVACSRSGALTAAGEELAGRQRRLIQQAEGLWTEKQRKQAEAIIEWCAEVAFQRSLFGR